MHPVISIIHSESVQRDLYHYCQVTTHPVKEQPHKEPVQQTIEKSVKRPTSREESTTNSAKPGPVTEPLFNT